MASVEQVASKWARRAGQAGKDYADGVQNPKRDWAEATGAAADNWNQGVTQAAGEGRFARGVSNAGTAKWKRGVETKGKARFQAGVQTAEGEFRQAFSPYLSALNSASLPPRGPKGDPGNIARVQAVDELMMEVKRQQG